MMLRGALAELRTLLLDLRPDALQDQSLGQVLNLLVEAARARTQASVALTVESDHQLPDDVTLALFRITQESLNNIVKHAEADHIALYLRSTAGKLELQITDDGIGYDPDAISPGKLGLSIMRDRAAEIGAQLIIKSEEGKGSTIVVNWRDRSNPIMEK
jgi:signal transduction histidine kinase